MVSHQRSRHSHIQAQMHMHTCRRGLGHTSGHRHSCKYYTLIHTHTQCDLITPRDTDMLAHTPTTYGIDYTKVWVSLGADTCAHRHKGIEIYKGTQVQKHKNVHTYIRRLGYTSGHRHTDIYACKHAHKGTGTNQKQILPYIHTHVQRNCCAPGDKDTHTDAHMHMYTSTKVLRDIHRHTHHSIFKCNTTYIEIYMGICFIRFSNACQCISTYSIIL